MTQMSEDPSSENILLLYLLVARSPRLVTTLYLYMHDLFLLLLMFYITRTYGSAGMRVRDGEKDQEEISRDQYQCKVVLMF